MKTLLLVLLISLLSSACSDKKTTQKTLIMGFVPSRSVHEIQVTSKKIADYLAQKTGYHIKSVTLSNYAGVALAMKSKRVDLAFVGPLNYLVINDHVSVEPITAALRHGKKGYNSLIIVRDDSDIHRIEDLEGKTFVFGDRLSASASLYPKSALLDSGVDPKEDIKSLMLSSQSAIVMSVLKGKVDAGAIYDDARMNPEVLKYAPNILSDTRIIYRSGLIPADPQIVRSSLDKTVKNNLRLALLDMSNDPEARLWLKDLYGIDSLVETNTSEYNDLRAVAALADTDILEPTIPQ